MPPLSTSSITYHFPLLNITCSYNKNNNNSSTPGGCAGQQDTSSLCCHVLTQINFINKPPTSSPPLLRKTSRKAQRDSAVYHTKTGPPRWASTPQAPVRNTHTQLPTTTFVSETISTWSAGDGHVTSQPPPLTTQKQQPHWNTWPLDYRGRESFRIWAFCGVNTLRPSRTGCWSLGLSLGYWQWLFLKLFESVMIAYRKMYL